MITGNGTLEDETMKAKRVQTRLSIDEELHAAIAKASAREGRSMAGWIQWTLRKTLGLGAAKDGRRKDGAS